MKRKLSLVLLSCALVLLCAACAAPAPIAAPTITIRVTTSLSGLSSEATESTITAPLENLLVSLRSLEQMHAMSAHGTSTIWIEFEAIGAEHALRMVKERVARAASLLPANVVGPVVTRSDNPWRR